MDDLKRLSAAVLSGANQAGPASSIPELANYFGSIHRNNFLKSATPGIGSLAGQRAEDEARAAEAARRERIQKLQDMLDPGKYEKQRKEDGGFSFFDPSGKEIDISTYVRRTGQRRADVLKDSENPIDQQYISDWSQMQTVMQGLWNNDPIVKELVSKRPELKGSPDEVSRRLMKHYPHMYGLGAYRQTLNNWNRPLFNFKADDPTSWGGGGGGGGLSL